MMEIRPERSSDAQRREEGLLRNLDAPHLLHPALAGLLLLEQLPLPRDVAAIALGRHVFAIRPHGLPGDDPLPHRGLHRHLELLAWDQLPELLYKRPPTPVRLVAVHDDGESVH